MALLSDHYHHPMLACQESSHAFYLRQLPAGPGDIVVCSGEAALCAQCSARVHGFRSITATRQHNRRKLQPGERVPSPSTCQVHPRLAFLSISSQQLICRGGGWPRQGSCSWRTGRQTRWI